MEEVFPVNRPCVHFSKSKASHQLNVLPSNNDVFCVPEQEEYQCKVMEILVIFGYVDRVVWYERERGSTETNMLRYEMAIAFRFDKRLSGISFDWISC